MSSIYEKRVTKHWTEFSIKVRSLSIGELQLLTKWLIDNVGDERAEFADAVTFEVRGDGDDAELVASVPGRVREKSPGLPLVSMREIHAHAVEFNFAFRVNFLQGREMVERITHALGVATPGPLKFEPGEDEVQIFGVPIRADSMVAPDCIRVGEQDYVLTRGSMQMIPLSEPLRVSALMSVSQSPVPSAPVVQPATGSDET
jgi:hypothetical protein